ncbi:MAG: S24 family peptidase [Ancalomicrobiaceae bacterium]|nr:S24 family peptidase [Ancalomicrobiaceae bacterium]
MPLPIYKEQHERLAWARRRADISLGALEELIGIKKSTARGHHDGTRSDKRGISDADLIKYARLYDVPFLWLKIGLDEAPPGFRRVDVKGFLQAGIWRSGFDLEQDRHIIVEDRREWVNCVLYAAEVRGESMNLVYPPGTIVVLLRQIDMVKHLEHRRRYHIERQRRDGTIENTLKTVEIKHGKVYLVPESNDPEFKQPDSISDADLLRTSFVGKVIQAIITE